MSNSFFPDNDFHQDQESVKFELYVQAQKAKDLTLALRRVARQAEKQQAEWFRQDLELVDMVMQQLVDGSVLAMDGLDLDTESSQLSIDLIENLREALAIIQSMFDFQTQVKH